MSHGAIIWIEQLKGRIGQVPQTCVAHAKLWSISSFAALRSSSYKCTMNAYIQAHTDKTQVRACTFGFAPVQTQSLSYSNRFPLLRKTWFSPADRPAAVPCCTVKFA